MWFHSSHTHLILVRATFLFPKLKLSLKGRNFWTVENLETAVTDQLKAILVSYFQRCYEE
jgi:hypothetical protein